MSKQAFDIEGDFQMGRIRQHFRMQVAAGDEQEARTHALADLGSRHGVNRRQVTITGVVPAKHVDAITKKRIGA